MSTSQVTIDRRAPLKSILAELAHAQKTTGATPYSKWLNRPVGRVFAASAFRLGLVPTQVTALSAAFTFSGIALIATAPPVFWAGPLIVALLAIGYALDSADGQLARLRHESSLSGEWLDHAVDSIKISSIHIAVLICWFRFYPVSDALLLLVPLAFCAEATICFFCIMLTEQLSARITRQGARGGRGGQHGALRTLAILPADYGILCWVFVVRGIPHLFVWVYLVLAILNILALLGALPRWYRRLRALTIEA